MKSKLDVYGIKNCDTVKKALKWINDNEIETEFHDFKKETPSDELVGMWLDDIGADTLINRRGTTWRKLSDEQKALTEKSDLINLITENTSLVKRPVVCHQEVWSVGFKLEDWEERFL